VLLLALSRYAKQQAEASSPSLEGHS
jgi:hypothetical protein